MKTAWLGMGAFALLALPAACGGSSDSGSGGSSSGGQSTGGASSGGTSSGGTSSGGTSSGGTSSGGTSSGGTSSGGTSSGGTSSGGAAGAAGTSTGGAAGAGGGNTGGSGGTSGTGGGNTGGTGGTGQLTCNQIAAEYLKTLAAAKACNAILGVVQCTSLVEDQLPCPCQTFVNPANTAEVKALQQLKAQWTAQKCSTGIICPAIACIPPASATCQASSGSTTGNCKDN